MEIAGKQITVNKEGYMIHPEEWNREVAEELAKEEGITLTVEHWPVLEYLREQHQKNVALSIRKVGKSGVVDIKGLYRLFPDGPLKKSSRIAGIPKPASCI